MSQFLMGVTEVAAQLGVTRQRVTQLADSVDFPPPVAELASGRIWDGNAVELWAQVHRNRPKGRPRGGYRIEYKGHHIEENVAFVVALDVRATDEADVDATFQRRFDFMQGRFVQDQLSQQLPPNEADVSLWRTMAGLATLQLRREIEAASQQIGEVEAVAIMEQRWAQYLHLHAIGMRHPIPPLRSGEVLHLWVNPALDVQLTPGNALIHHVHMECGHWIERSRVEGDISLFSTEARCPTCGAVGRAVGLWPQR